MNGPGGDPLTNVNRSVVSLVKRLISDSDPDPVIVIMSDHGEKPDPGTVEQNRALYARYARYPRGALDRAAILESWYPVNNVEIFCLPDGGEKSLYPGMTPVNAWRMVLNYYFGTDFPRLDDRVYWKWQGDRGIIELN